MPKINLIYNIIDFKTKVHITIHKSSFKYLYVGFFLGGKVYIQTNKFICVVWAYKSTDYFILIN